MQYADKTILVVEDDDINRKVVVELLKFKCGFNVSSASSGEEALEIMRKVDKPFDVVISDIYMPGMTGSELVGIAKALYPQTDFIAISGYPNDTNVIQCLASGAIDFITKPIDADRLVSCVVNAIDRVKPDSHENDFVVKSDVQGWVDITAPTEYEYIERFQRFALLVGDAPLSDEEKANVRLALAELGQNAIEWGNKKDLNKQIKLSYCLFRDRIVFKVEDEGEGFMPDSIRDPSVNPIEHVMLRMKEKKRPGGYGIFITKKIMDEVVYNDTGSAVIMTKML